MICSQDALHHAIRDLEASFARASSEFLMLSPAEIEAMTAEQAKALADLRAMLAGDLDRDAEWLSCGIALKKLAKSVDVFRHVLSFAGKSLAAPGGTDWITNG